MVFVLGQYCLIQTSDILDILLRPKAATVRTILHLFLRQDCCVISLLVFSVTVLLDYGIKRVKIWVALAHGLARAWRHDSSRDGSFFNSQCIIVLGHILLLADQAIQTLDILWTQLIVL